ncbi:alanine/glycine:cation symporter family protein [Nocardiopsis changdeensis]|uniref:Sodium:alanine symporter family protein n=1 Tax=Nocardiopsis changdeensis TaxID=2831969 RepID=A0ABX8BH21_9ACTN|nr:MULTISPECIES: sodium:alanine symporter family protein [Nocardiopsis]QUX21512.1 sodium:alanine symporter family protein [Nocardiopsis changdeensis]QYX37446.1 sodium:alanine symporter family protein [Nocardiopsis sp. MT53]
MDQLLEMAGLISGIIWGPFVLIPLLFAVGLFLTIRLNLLQLLKLPHALWLALVRRKEDDSVEGDISHYQALSTALAATVGVGNIAGAALAIGIGGPGALFWMWVVGFLGMATKYSEALLGVKFRRADAKGEQSGGPMYYLKYGIGGGFGTVLGVLFAVFGAIAAFGIGNGSQANTVAQQINSVTGVDTWIIGLVLMVLTAAVILGGIKSIGRVASALVPIMIIGYVGICLAVLAANWAQLLPALQLVVTDAFTGTAAAGGFAGSTVLIAIQMGFARGIFSNESGLGTGGIAAAAAKTRQPVRQAMVSMTQTFIDTIIVVTMTCMVIITTGVWQGENAEDGSLLTSQAMTQGLEAISPSLAPAGAVVVAISVAVFAFTTLLGWSYYGDRCIEFLVGRRFVLPYRLLFIVVVFVGSVASLDSVWLFSDIANGLMALPNLVGLLVLSPLVVAETRKFFAHPDWKNPDALMDDVVKG